MIKVDQVKDCKRLYAQGMKIRAIARRLGLSRNTVRVYVRGERHPGDYRMEVKRSQPVQDRIRPWVRHLLEEEQEKKTPRKQRLTASRIERLLARDGIEASEAVVRRVVREVRLELDDPLKRAYLPLEDEPGEDAQVDFYEGFVDDPEGERQKAHVLLVRACYSSRTYAYAAPNQTREALLEGLMRAFEHFGGVFPTLWFDNLTPVVKKVLRGTNRKLQEAFEHFQAYYGFHGEFCAPGKGNEKGGVEGSVKYSRHEILSPIPVVSGRGALQSLCDAWMQSELHRRPRGRDQPRGQDRDRPPRSRDAWP